jgi:hypothetical protein
VTEPFPTFQETILQHLHHRIPLPFL